jgi:hypothetical protein
MSTSFQSNRDLWWLVLEYHLSECDKIGNISEHQREHWAYQDVPGSAGNKPGSTNDKFGRTDNQPGWRDKKTGSTNISNNSSFCQKHPGVPDGCEGSDRGLYPQTENYLLPIAQATGKSLLDWCSGLQIHLRAAGSTLHHCRAVWEKHLLWECGWCAWTS